MDATNNRFYREPQAPGQALAAILRAEFTTTQLHAFIVAAEHPDNRGGSHWERLRKAAIVAADCNDCVGR